MSKVETILVVTNIGICTGVWVTLLVSQILTS